MNIPPNWRLNGERYRLAFDVNGNLPTGVREHIEKELGLNVRGAILRTFAAEGKATMPDNTVIVAVGE